MTAVLYIHGKGGSAQEAEHYKALFPEYAVFGIDYKGTTPQEAGKEIADFVKSLGNEKIILVASSIGAYFAMTGNICGFIEKAFFISPIVDMEKLILQMMQMSGITEAELKEKGEIPTAFGETLSWEYLSYVREHPVKWDAPTEILYGEKDNLTAYETVSAFCKKHNANLTVMENGEHWFHTEQQMRFLDDWIKRS